MTRNEADHWLQQAGIRPTANRLLVVETLARAHQTLSLADLERLLETLDRSSIFRTLRTLAEHHLVHEINDPTGIQRYELCHSHLHHALGHDDNPLYHDDEHVHFFCEQCQQTFCLTDSPIPALSLPLGYHASTATLLVRGLCPRCAQGH